MSGDRLVTPKLSSKPLRDSVLDVTLTDLSASVTGSGTGAGMEGPTMSVR
ncbi:hypothetical protein LVJ94_24775 [Pendulispora rubella]|uniref:Uncharacterized protein n=1 Tax=Pendulispora rubella TaxID=2741070 RepID=A0ABZ2LHK2_9BACT